MLRYIGIAPLSLLVVMVLYLGMYGLLNQQHTIDFKENESEFSFDDYQLPTVLETGRTFSCGLGRSTPPTKAELWKEVYKIIFSTSTSACFSDPYESSHLSAPNIQQISQGILSNLTPDNFFKDSVTSQNKPNQQPYNQALTLAWLPTIKFPTDTGRIEGWVKLEIQVNAQGTVGDIHVIAAKPPRVFDRSAIRAYKKAKFLPEIINGKAVAKTIIQRVDFKLAED